MTTVTDINSAPLVGAHFHPPAKLLLQHLPTGQVLRLIRDPDNAYDTNAIAVWADIEKNPDIPMHELIGFGVEEESFPGSFMLGHIAAKTGEAKALAPILDSGHMPKATLAFDAKGAPRVALEWSK